jgi:hypothetical protein
MNMLGALPPLLENTQTEKVPNEILGNCANIGWVPEFMSWHADKVWRARPRVDGRLQQTGSSFTGSPFFVARS